MLAAAKTLGCIGLEELCMAQRGEFTSRVRTEGISWEEAGPGWG